MIKNLFKKIVSNPYGKYNGNEALYVLEVLDSENKKNKELPWVNRFESAFSEKYGMKYAIAHNSGTSTLHSCLVAIGVGAGDEVIVPAHTVIMCSWAAIYQNAVPIYADSDPFTFNMDPEDIKKKITPKTKAIIIVHMHGLPANVPAILKIAREKNIYVVEDCAQCVFGKLNGKLAGTFGDFSSFSFETKKHLSTGEGGMVCTNNEDFAIKVRKNGGLGYKTLTAKSGLRNILPSEFQDPDYKRHDTLGWNYRMPELIAAVGLAQLERVDEFIKRRKLVAQMYLDAFEGCSWIIPQKVESGFEHSYWTFTVRYEGKEKIGVSWKDFYNKHVENGGDRFYGALSLAYNEIMMQERKFYGMRILENVNIYPN